MSGVTSVSASLVKGLCSHCQRFAGDWELVVASWCVHARLRRSVRLRRAALQAAVRSIPVGPDCQRAKDGVRFELTGRCRPTVFKTAAFNRSSQPSTIRPAGVEPACPFGRRVLSTVRLPISPRAVIRLAGLEPATLSGRVFETRVYAVPPQSVNPIGRIRTCNALASSATSKQRVCRSATIGMILAKPNAGFEPATGALRVRCSSR